MKTLVDLVIVFRRFVSRAYGLGLLAALCAYVGTGGPLVYPNWVSILAGAVWGLLALRRIGERIRQVDDLSVTADLELGGLFASLLYAGLLYQDGRVDGRTSPLVYLMVATIAAFSRPVASLATTGIMIGFEAMIRTRFGQSLAGPEFVTRAAFIGSFALVNMSLLRAEAARIRRQARKEVEKELNRQREDARHFRLLGAGETRLTVSEDRLERSSVEEVHQSMHYALSILRRSLNLHTAVLLWKNESGTHFRIAELSTSSDDVVDAPIPIGEGVLAVVNHRREILVLDGLKPRTHMPYYQGSCPVAVLAAVPIVDTASRTPFVRAVLIVDRVEGSAFSAEEQGVIEQAAAYCGRAVDNQRVFLQLERAKVEQGKLYRAAQSLGAALSEEEVLEAGVRAAREIASFDLAAVTLFDDTTHRHHVVAALGPAQFENLVGQNFAHNTGLVSMVVQNRFALPYKGDYDAAHQVVLSKRLAWPEMDSLLVLPLVTHDRVLGTLILGADRKQAFADSVRSTLEVLAAHFAVSLSNARMVKTLEEMATTDGLTGLLNKRAMLDSAIAKLQAAERFGRKLSVIVTDIDHFKRVNDTYGHDVGDQVIKGLGQILERHKRSTDLVARFGGEEFVVLCEQTDEVGALQLAERIREALSKVVFQSELGGFSVTCSLGVSTYPADGKNWETMFKAADEALYESKRGGRNRSTSHRPRKSERVPVAPGSSRVLGDGSVDRKRSG